MWLRYKKIIVVMGIIAIATICFLYYRFDPESGIFPRCVFKQMTGWDCPGCGSQRAVHALLHGEIARAWGYNAGLFVAIPLIAILRLGEMYRTKSQRIYRAIHHPIVPIAIMVGIIGWTVMRNTLG